MGMIRILTFTTLFPNDVQPRHGIFVEQRLRKLLDLGGIEARVIAPVPWFPFRAKLFGQYAQYASVAREEVRHGIHTSHPKYLNIPKIGMSLAPFLIAFFTYFHVRKMIKNGFEFDLIDAHYFYPDGVAAAILASLLKKPLVITARGSDINLLPNYSIPRRLILWATSKAWMSFTVCNALKDKMTELGAEGGKVHVMRNGVDHEKFRLLDREQCRKKLSIDQPTLLSVGNLVELKGHHLVIEAMKSLPEHELVIVGDGEEYKNLVDLTKKLGVDNRVRFLGTINQEQLVEVYNAVDILVLASSREGWANVLLESMACGTPVVATNVGGTLEVVKSKEAGIVIPERTSKAILDGVSELSQGYPERSATRAYAKKFSWEETVTAIHKQFDIISATVD